MLEMKDVDVKSEILATDLILFVTNIVLYLELSILSIDYGWKFWSATIGSATAMLPRR